METGGNVALVGYTDRNIYNWLYGLVQLCKWVGGGSTYTQWERVNQRIYGRSPHRPSTY